MFRVLQSEAKRAIECFSWKCFLTGELSSRSDPILVPKEWIETVGRLRID